MKQEPLFYNVNVFAATLFARMSTIAPVNLGWHSLTVLNGAIGKDAHDQDPEERAYVAMYLPAAEAWMKIAGRQVLAMCSNAMIEALTLRDHTIPVSPNGLWEWWRQGFERLAADKRLDAKLRSHAAGALDHVRVAERD